MVITPNEVYTPDWGFFFTESMGSLKVVFNSGWVTLASLKRRPMGLINLSCFGGFLVKFSPTKQILLILLFQHFLFLLPDRMISNISASVMGLTFWTGTDHFPAFSLRFCLIMLVNTLEFLCCYRSIRYAGTAPYWISSTRLLAFFSSCYFIVFFICIFCLNLSLLKSLALRPLRVCDFLAIILVFLAYFFLLFSGASSLYPNLFLWRSM